MRPTGLVVGTLRAGLQQDLSDVAADMPSQDLLLNCPAKHLTLMFIVDVMVIL